MRTAAKRYPRKKDVAVVFRTLQACIPTDQDIRGEWRFSQSGAPNYRLSCSVKGAKLCVDVYAGDFFHVMFDNKNDTFHFLPSVVRFIQKNADLPGLPNKKSGQREVVHRPNDQDTEATLESTPIISKKGES